MLNLVKDNYRLYVTCEGRRKMLAWQCGLGTIDDILQMSVSNIYNKEPFLIAKKLPASNKGRKLLA